MRFLLVILRSNWILIFPICDSYDRSKLLGKNRETRSNWLLPLKNIGNRILRFLWHLNKLGFNCNSPLIGLCVIIIGGYMESSRAPLILLNTNWIILVFCWSNWILIFPICDSYDRSKLLGKNRETRSNWFLPLKNIGNRILRFLWHMDKLEF